MSRVNPRPLGLAGLSPADAGRTGRGPSIGPVVVVAAFDRSDGSSHAVTYAAGLAERAGARLVVINVDRASMVFDCPIGPRVRVGEVADEVRDLIGAAPCGCDVLVATGNPAATIRHLAADLRADVLVVGRPRHPLRHVSGSLSARLARTADRPVLVP